MRIYWKNDIEDASLSASSADTGQSTDSLTIPQLARTFQFTGNDEYVRFTFDSAKNIKSFIVDRGNLSTNASVNLRAFTDGTFTTASYVQSLTETDTCYYLDLDQTSRWWSISFSDTTISKVKIGYITISEEPYLQLPGIDPQSELFYNTTSQNALSIGGQVYSDEGYRYLETNFSFPQIGETSTYILTHQVASRKDILEMWNHVQNIAPFWAFLWADNLDEIPPVFCIFNQESMRFTKQSYGKYYSTDISLREVK